jgi:hypothetical protein
VNLKNVLMIGVALGFAIIAYINGNQEKILHLEGVRIVVVEIFQH